MNDCDIRSPYWNSKDCPGKYDAGHICRACKVQKVSENRIKYPFKKDVDIVSKYACSIR
jgi:hypothetical protein